MVDRSLGFATDGEEGWKSLLVGGVTLLLSPVLLGVPVVFIAGYLVRVIRAAADGGETPTWDGNRDMAGDGARFLLATAAYLAVFATVGLAVGAAVLVAADLRVPGQTIGAFADTLAALLLSLAVLIGLLTLPVAQVRFVLTDSVAGALNVSKILEASVSLTYVETWLPLAVLWAIAWPFVLPLWFVLVGPFVVFYMLVDSYHMFGQSAAAELSVEERGSQRPTPRTIPGEGRA